MKKARRIVLTLVCVALAFALIAGGGMVLASYGDQNDPLVSLSYLTNDFTNAILSKVDERISAREKTINETIEARISEYIQTVQQSGGDGDSGFKVVTLSTGQVLQGYIGTEMMLRSGSATCSALASPGLVDTTTGDTVDGGGAISVNHLYIVSADGRGAKAVSECTLLVRGTYIIS